MKLIFQDEFDYEGLPDKTKWGYDIGGGGFGNNEDQYYTDSINNAFVKDGKLTIKAIKEDKENRKYTSARLKTYEKFSFTYGRIEVSAKLPRGKGSWPAIWMLPDSIKNGVSWPLCGEIDIMEHVGKDENMVHVSLHSEKYNHIIGTQDTHFQTIDNVFDKFHKYVCDWTKDYIDFYYDDEKVARFDRNTVNGNPRDNSEKGWPFDQPYHLILNIACGGNWGGEIDDSMLPYIMEIEYVRIYQ